MQNLIIALCSSLTDEPEQNITCGEPASIGSKPDFETVLRAYHKKIYNLTYRLIGNDDDASDLTQETFVNAYKAFSKFNGPSDSVYAWLCRIAVNCCKNRYKEKKRARRHEGISLDQTFEDGAMKGIEIADISGDPAGILQRRDLDERIQEAIQALPHELRLVVVLRDMHGLSYKEITEAAGLTIEIVKVRLFRGREILRRRLSHFVGE